MRTTATLSRFLHRPSALFTLPEPVIRRLGQFLAALVAGAGIWGLAGLLWGFSSPPPRPVAPREARPQILGERIAARALFAARHDTAATPAVTVDNWQLLGVTASDDERTARAIIRREGQAMPQVLSIGDEIDRGIRLLRIEPEQIVLRGQVGENVLRLPRPRQAEPLTRHADHD